MGTSIDLKRYADYQFESLYQQQIHLTKYSRWNDELKRRETWPETVYRYIDFMVDHIKERCDYTISSELQHEIYEAILNLEVMPSMRALMTAGPALKRDESASYNCSYTNIDRIAAFDEIMYLLMCGVGTGFSVERQFINELPDLPGNLYPTDSVIVVRDSRIGWASALRQLLSVLFSGVIPKWDLRKIRPAGSLLKTFGGRASGPGPLDDLFRHIVNTFQSAVQQSQRKLTSLQCHSIITKIGDAVVSGGVRRSAQISFSNPSDQRMRDAKSGNWAELNPHFALANNSAAWTDKPDVEIFLEEWLALIKSKSGERGIFNRQAAQKQAASNGRRKAELVIGSNPCNEILLRDRQKCNLSEVVVRANDTFESLAYKIKIATILGTFQSTLTNFRYLSSKWRENCEEERLLGVSLTGIFDHPFLSTFNQTHPGFPDTLPKTLEHFKTLAIDVNKTLAEKLGINQSTAITCIKPSGTVSALVNSASGVHPRHAPFYIRTNRGNKIDPLSRFMFDHGFVAEDDVIRPEVGWVFYFPLKSPENAIFRKDLRAIDHLNIWMLYNKHWCEHKPSVTISVREHEWLDVGAFVYKHFDEMSGVSFLPYSEHTYRQAPFQECSKEEYEALLVRMPQVVDWSRLFEYEKSDQTTGSREFSCVGNSCEIN